MKSAFNKIKDLIVYDMLGKIIYKDNPNGKIITINSASISDGTILLIKVVFDDDSIQVKKHIK